MKTQYIKAVELKIKLDQVKLAILNDQLIVFPTETVYGLGASIYSPTAIKNIFAIKGRPQDNPLIVHIGHENQLNDLVLERPLIARRLIDSFWPGPLTLVFKKSKVVTDLITAGMDTVAIRMPSHPIAKDLLRLIDIPLCAPSANYSGKPSGTTFESVKEDFDGKAAIIFESEASSIGIESTVLDISKKPYTILRPGAITKEDIEMVINETVETSTNYHAPRAPGMKYTHYKPFGEVIILDGTEDKIIKYLSKNAPPQAVFIGATEICQLLNINTIALGSLKSLDKIAQNLYRVLRQLDQLKIKTIYTHTFDRTGIGEAIMNRLEKAAENHIVDLRK